MKKSKKKKRVRIKTIPLVEKHEVIEFLQMITDKKFWKSFFKGLRDGLREFRKDI